MAAVRAPDLGGDVGQDLVARGTRFLAFVGLLGLRGFGTVGDDAAPRAAAAGLEIHGVEQDLEGVAHVTARDRQDHPLGEPAFSQRRLELVVDTGHFLRPLGQRSQIAVSQEGNPHARARFRRGASLRRFGGHATKYQGHDCEQAEHREDHLASYLTRQIRRFSRWPAGAAFTLLPGPRQRGSFGLGRCRSLKEATTGRNGGTEPEKTLLPFLCPSASLFLPVFPPGDRHGG